MELFAGPLGLAAEEPRCNRRRCWPGAGRAQPGRRPTGPDDPAAACSAGPAAATTGGLGHSGGRFRPRRLADRSRFHRFHLHQNGLLHAPGCIHTPTSSRQRLQPPGTNAQPSAVLAAVCTRSSMALITMGSARVVTSPSARFSATSRSSRRMSLPERVLGSSGVIMIWRGLAIGPISRATWLRSSCTNASPLDSSSATEPFTQRLQRVPRQGRIERGHLDRQGDSTGGHRRRLLALDGGSPAVLQDQGPSSTERHATDWSGRQIKAHRSEIRGSLGFRECSVADAEKLTAWLAEHVAQAERRPDQVRVELLARCWEERIEPPGRTRVERILASALYQGEETLFAGVTSRLPPEVATRLVTLIVAGGDGEDDEGRAGIGGGPSVLALIKTDPGNVSLESMLTEIDKLLAVRAVGVPAEVFADVAPRVLAGWRAQAAVESPSHLRAHPNPAKTLTLLAALLHIREREITDTLVELLIATVHRINAPRREEGHRRADQRLQEGDRQGEHPVLDRRGLACGTGGEGAPGGVPGDRRRGGDAAGAGTRVPDEGAGVPDNGGDHTARLLHQPLSARADPAARGAPVPVQQRLAPAG